MARAFALLLLLPSLAGCLTNEGEASSPCAHLGHIVNAPEARVTGAKDPFDKTPGGPRDLYFIASDDKGYEEGMTPDNQMCVRFALPHPGTFRFYARDTADECRWEGSTTESVRENEVIDVLVHVAYTC